MSTKLCTRRRFAAARFWSRALSSSPPLAAIPFAYVSITISPTFRPNWRSASWTVEDDEFHATWVQEVDDGIGDGDGQALQTITLVIGLQAPLKEVPTLQGKDDDTTASLARWPRQSSPAAQWTDISVSSADLPAPGGAIQADVSRQQ